MIFLFLSEDLLVHELSHLLGQGFPHLLSGFYKTLGEVETISHKVENLLGDMFIFVPVPYPSHVLA